MFRKKLILIYLIVCYCVIVGKSEAFTSQDHNGSEKEPNKVLINLILSRSRFYFLDDENSKENTAARRKKKWRNKAKRKGRTFFVPAENILIRNKQAILRGRSHKNNTLRKQLYKCFEKLRNIYVEIISFVSRLDNKTFSNRFRDLRPTVKGKQKCKQYSKDGSNKSKVDKYNYVSVKKIRSTVDAA